MREYEFFFYQKRFAPTDLLATCHPTYLLPHLTQASKSLLQTVVLKCVGKCERVRGVVLESSQGSSTWPPMHLGISKTTAACTLLVLQEMMIGNSEMLPETRGNMLTRL
jgi:hypothetical protein